MKSSFLSLSSIYLILPHISINNAQVDETLVCGQEVSGSINLGERKYYEVPINSDYNSIIFEGCDSNFDLELYFYDNQDSIPNSPIASCDWCNDFGGSQDNCGHRWATDLSVHNVVAGNYFFAVGGWNDLNAGDYVIQLICQGAALPTTPVPSTHTPTHAPTTPAPTKTPTTQSVRSISCGETITGSLIPDQIIYYQLVLSQGYYNLEFEGCRSNFDLDLSLETANGATTLARCDDCRTVSPNTGCNHVWASDLEYGPINAGSYRFGIREWSGDNNGGQYEITLECKTPPTQPPSSSDQCPESHRFRKSWLEMSQNERNLYVSGFKQLADLGIVNQFTQAHLDSAIHNAAAFLPWHRHFVYLMESEIRNLGGEFACFSMPYWDSAGEQSPSEVSGNWADELIILNSGLGGDSGNECLNDGSNFEMDNYSPLHPFNWDCLVRDLDYTTDGVSDCAFTNHATIMGNYVDEYEDFSTFAQMFEGTPHALPHICIGGGNSDGRGQMVTFYSPADPIFYLHHAFIDYVYALWQDCHNYENNIFINNWPMSYSPLNYPDNNARDTFDIINDYGYSYEKGLFWTVANVEKDDRCGVNSGQAWFTDSGPTDRRRMVSENGMNNGIRRRADVNGMEIYELLSTSERNRRNRDNNNGNGDRNRNIPEQSVYRRDISRRWAKMVCEQEEYEKGKYCEKPSGYYDDCKGMVMDSKTNDIDITLNELLEKEGITECMKETRRRYYKWAKEFGYLKYLCVGCFDPFCDQNFLQPICTNINTHYEMS